MLFNSTLYMVFLPVVVALYFAIPQRRRWMLLLAASYYFYMCWKVEYALLIMASTLIDYYAGLRMGAQPERRGRRKYLILSLVCNLGLLFSFKYFLLCKFFFFSFSFDPVSFFFSFSFLCFYCRLFI